MKVVTAFVGSARRNGVTYRAVRRFLDDVEALGGVRSEIVFLSDHHVGLCRGCKACFLRGEEWCPLRDDRDLLIGKMRAADGVVLASPNYSFQVSGHVKAFLDRLGFALHRPCFHGRTFTSIVAEGLFGGADLVRYLDLVGGGLGFNVVKGSCVTCRQNPNTASDPIVPEELRPMEVTLARHARRFHARLLGPQLGAPSLVQLLAFRMARTSFALELDDAYRDHVHYRDHGWFEADYFYPTRLGPLKRAAGALADRLAARGSRRRAAQRQAAAPR